LPELTPEEWKEQLPEAGTDVLEILSLENSVARRKTYGGTAFGQVALQIGRGKDFLREKAEALESEKERLALGCVQ
jgi:argininosuccinate lyase